MTRRAVLKKNGSNIFGKRDGRGGKGSSRDEQGENSQLIAAPTSRRVRFPWLASRERLPRTIACCLRGRPSGAVAEPACCRDRDSLDPAGWQCAELLPPVRPRPFVLAPRPA